MMHNTSPPPTEEAYRQPAHAARPRLLHVFDRGGSLLLQHAWGAAVQTLPFAIASLTASLAAYADDSGYELQRIQLEHCAMTYHRWVSE